MRFSIIVFVKKAMVTNFKYSEERPTAYPALKVKLMNPYLVLYAFHRINALSLHRLILLKKKTQNSNTIITPFFGIPPSIYLPTLVRPRGWVLNSSALFCFNSKNLFNLNDKFKNKHAMKIHLTVKNS